MISRTTSQVDVDADADADVGGDEEILDTSGLEAADWIQAGSSSSSAW